MGRTAGLELTISSVNSYNYQLSEDRRFKPQLSLFILDIGRDTDLSLGHTWLDICHLANCNDSMVCSYQDQES